MTDQETDQEVLRRRRAAAAFVLITASLCVGVLLGRMSASFTPTETPQKIATQTSAVAGQTSEPPKPLALTSDPAPQAQPPAQAAAPPQPVASQPAPQPAAPQPPKLEITKDPAAATSASAPTASQFVSASAEGQLPSADNRESPNSDDTKSAESKVTVINSGSSEPAQEPKRSKVAKERTGASTEKVVAEAASTEARPGGSDECERRYSSFRRDDGTYQPYGGGPRIRCPHLR